MDKHALLRVVSSARDHKVIAEELFNFLSEHFSPHAMYFVQAPSTDHHPKPGFSKGEFVAPSSFPSTFWAWAAQFDTSDGLIPLEINTCSWNYKETLNGECFLMMFDNHPEWRTYLFVEAVDPEKYQTNTTKEFLDILNITAARWQCLRAERNASLEFKNRDMREAKYLDEIRQRETFIQKMKLVQQVALELSNPASLDDLYKGAVEAIRDRLGFDRSVFMLLDMKKRCFTSTYGTTEQGETQEEHQSVYDLHQLEDDYIEALHNHETSLVIMENAPLYTTGSVVGQGWNGMLILRDENEPVGWIAIDNYIHREPITAYQKEMLKSFGSLLSQIYIRKKQEQNIRLLHSSMVALSRCTTVNEVCKSAVDFAINNLGIDRMAVFLTDPELTHLRGTWGTDIQGNVVDESYYETKMQRDRPLVSTAINKPNALSLEESVPIYHDKRIVGFGWTAMTMLKSSSEGPIAFLAADNLLTRKPMTSQLQEMMLLFASNLAEVLQRTRAQEAIRTLNENLEQQVRNRTLELELANQQLEALSSIDPLTRLGNRRQLSKHMDDIATHKSGSPQNIGLILLDIDHFGLFNQEYGHLEGDIALIRLGNILSNFCDSNDETFCRIGGEEFALLLSDTTESKTRKIAEKIRKCIETDGIPHAKNDSSSVLTVSIGYLTESVLPSKFDFDSMYSKADKALYQAKDLGRNRIVNASDVAIVI
ncbi:sensor domain-containing diguanylate cyclase [Vibrio penaeicida]|uniref:diguanylate cyclase n=1 Tax=Vibrio penaeicida TaxID=104609 RepID=A0AAV5P0K6_9VIBR|nr:GGDEF domain-containing protein [Vibrio penaeicida]RTZ19518.1 GGDEF domain-containing protein [Vibrio penaeicida]GLQ76312.1 GGDEF domain-containing protein [Vibrio penaeicida]